MGSDKMLIVIKIIKFRTELFIKILKQSCKYRVHFNLFYGDSKKNIGLLLLNSRHKITKSFHRGSQINIHYISTSIFDYLYEKSIRIEFGFSKPNRTKLFYEERVLFKGRSSKIISDLLSPKLFQVLSCHIQSHLELPYTDRKIFKNNSLRGIDEIKRKY